MSNGTNFPDLPLWKDMNWSANCSSWGNYLSSFVMPNPWEKSEVLGGSPWLAIYFFMDSAPRAWQDNMTEHSLISISDWFASNYYANLDNSTGESGSMNPAFEDDVLFGPMYDCPAEFCKALGYMGNVDLTGIGVYVSYYAEASLATLYLIAFTIWSIRHHNEAKKGRRLPGSEEAASGSPKPAKITLGQRVLDSFRGSLDNFLTTSMLMSLVMLTAALYIAIDRSKERSVPFTDRPALYASSAIYDMVLSLLAASFSVFPVLLLYALMGRRDAEHAAKDRAGRHRLWLRRIVLVILWALGSAEVYLSPRGEPDYDQRHSGDQEANNDFCNERGGTRYWAAVKAAQFLVIGAPLLWMTLTAFVVTGFGIPGLAHRPWVRRWRAVWRLGVAWLNMLLMWALLAYFTILRHNIIKTSGGVDNENEWGFGQVLALATWIPVVIEFAAIFLWGIETNLDSHLPTGFAVQRVHEEASLFNAAMIGVDPLHQDHDSVSLYDSKQPATMAVTPPGAHDKSAGGADFEMAPLHSSTDYSYPHEQALATTTTAYHGGGHYQMAGDPGQQHGVVQGPGPNYGESQTAWQHWNSTGW